MSFNAEKHQVAEIAETSRRGLWARVGHGGKFAVILPRWGCSSLVQ
jgi:hypothetical protein